MSEFNKKLEKDLEEINLRISKCNDEYELRVLNHDKNIILFWLSDFKNSNSMDVFTFNSRDIFASVIENYGFKPNFFSFLVLPNIKSNENIFNKFMEAEKLGLKKIYEQAIKDNSIFLTNKDIRAKGVNIRIFSLKKNYILVRKKNSIHDGLVISHELGHSKNHSFPNNGQLSNFEESYTYFINLLYYDTISEYGMSKQAFNYKLELLNMIIGLLDILYNSLDKFNSIEFKSSYRLFVSILLALHLYEIYCVDHTKALKQLEILNNNINKMDDYELLNSMNISFDIFKNNKIISNFLNQLHVEKRKIRSK